MDSGVYYTGNEYVLLGQIEKAGGGIKSLGFVLRSLRGCAEMGACAGGSLIAPFVRIDGQDIVPKNICGSFDNYWIPKFTCSEGGISAVYRIVAPTGRRGFVCMLALTNTGDQAIRLEAGWQGSWSGSTVISGRPKPTHAYRSIKTVHGPEIIMELLGQTPVYALALFSPECCDTKIFSEEEAKSTCSSYCTGCFIDLEAGQSRTLSLYAGVGLEEVSACASAAEMQLQGSEKLAQATMNWLDERVISCEDQQIQDTINLNSFYNYFFCQAVTLDTEEFVVTTSRCSSHEFAGAYRDRDAMRWSLPAVLQVSWSDARRMLIYGLTTQLNNIGLHSRFIDGIALEPGLQLDQLCAPIRALDTYVDRTGDLSLLFDRRVQNGINRVQQLLADQRHSTEALFETLLLPSGEYADLPYVCYTNALVCRVLEDIAALYGRIRDMDRADEAMTLAKLVKESIMAHFIFEGPFGEMFAHSIDMEGNYKFGDSVEGSLQMLSFLNFCKPDCPVYSNTVKWIHSEHNPDVDIHSRLWSGENDRGYSMLAAVNQLLTGKSEDIIGFLKDSAAGASVTPSLVDRITGESIARTTAGYAGYLAYALCRAVNAVLPATSIVTKSKKGGPNESLYHPPPRSKQHSRKARL